MALGFLADHASAQRSQSSSAPGGVAVIDVSYIFKNHTRFKKMMDDMKEDVKQVEVDFRKRRQEIEDQIKDAKRFKPDSADFKAREERIARAQSKLQVDMRLAKKNFQEREAKVYYQVYQEILDEVEYFSRRNNIDLVLRFNSQKIDPGNHVSVLQGVNRAVVFQQRIDITLPILNALNGGAKPPTNISRDPRRAIPGG